jgi:hypothetical protein
VAAEITRMLLTLSPVGSESVFPSLLASCPICASFMRLTRTEAGGRRPVPDSVQVEVQVEVISTMPYKSEFAEAISVNDQNILFP